MSAIVLIDTSVLMNVLDVPGRNESRTEVLTQLRVHLESGDNLLLPMAAIIEAGNHIAHCGNGHERRQTAECFVNEVRKALCGDAPWKMMQFPDNEQVVEWLAEYPASANRGIGFGDLSIIKEWENTCTKFPLSRVLIWSLDSDLSAYDRTT